MADNFKTISDLDISFKEFMPGQVIQSTQFNDDMKDIEEKVNEVIGQHNGVASTVVDHLNNKNNPHKVTAQQVGTYTVDEIDGLIEEVKDGHLYDNAITNRVLGDGCVDNRTLKDKTITAVKVEDGFGNQIDISENIEITDRYTKSEVDELVRSKVGEGAYTKEEIDEKFQNFQAGQIIDKTISADKVTSDFGDNIDISNNTSITNRYTKGEVDMLISMNGLPRDWGNITEQVDVDTGTGSLPVAGHMVAGQFVSPATSVLDIDVKENVEARGEYNSVGERLDGIDSQIENIETRIDNLGGSGGSSGGEVDLSGYVTKEIGNANQITFIDGQTFQAKLDAGILKGDKGDQGEQGSAGQDGLTTAISVNGTTYTHSNGIITLPDYPTGSTDVSNAIVYKGVIPASGNLNDCTTTGFYKIQQGARNLPVNEYSFLMVYNEPGENTLIQVWYSVTSDKQRIRRRAGTTWGNWYKVYTENEPPTIPSTGGGVSSNDTNVINVKEMGAVGDGVTNDLSALKTIFQNAEDNQTIYFPEGTYLLGSGNSEQILLTLSNKNNVKIKGQSYKNTKIIAHQNTPASINMGMIALDSCTNCSIEDIELDGNSQLRHVAYGGTNWGDNDTTMRNTSNIMIIGGERVTVKNVYSHHPIMDCICIERKGGGDSPASKYIYVEDCILDYGYRQGISIVGSDYGIIKNTKITNTANALDLNRNDGVTVIGTSPKAGIDSETFIWNHHWLIDNCYFESNKGGHINMNDGASEHTIERCTFIGDSVTIEGIGSETPSNGTRTLNNIVSKCDFRNCKLNINGGVFTVVNNTFTFDDTSIRSIPIKIASTTDANGRNGACIFSNNRVSVRLDLFVRAGIELSSLNFYVSIFEKNGCIVSNNVFHNLIGPNIFGAINSNKTIITNNTFSTDQNLKDLDIICSISSSCLVTNNIVVGNYPTAVFDKLSNIVNTSKFNKEQNKYKICDSFSLYKNRKVSFKIMNFADFNMLNAKTTILERCVNDKHVPTKIEYDIVAYKKNGKLVQKCNFRNILGNDEYFVTCFGFEVIDGILYLSFLNELDDSEIVDINIELDDINKEIDPDILDLRKIALNENIPSLYEIDVKPKRYNVGDRVRSGYRCAEMYYEVTTGGTVKSNQTFDDSRDYKVDGVVFKYKGYYRTNTFGNALECSRLIVPSSLDFTSRDTKTIRTITFPVNTTDRITYTSSAPSIVTVTNTGVVTPVSNGDAVITITCGNQTKTCNIHVSGI